MLKVQKWPHTIFEFKMQVLVKLRVKLVRTMVNIGRGTSNDNCKTNIHIKVKS